MTELWYFPFNINILKLELDHLRLFPLIPRRRHGTAPSYDSGAAALGLPQDLEK